MVSLMLVSISSLVRQNYRVEPYCFAFSAYAQQMSGLWQSFMEEHVFEVPAQEVVKLVKKSTDMHLIKWLINIIIFKVIKLIIF